MILFYTVTVSKVPCRNWIELWSELREVSEDTYTRLTE